MRAFKYKIGWLLLIMMLFAGCASIEKAEALHRRVKNRQLWKWPFPCWRMIVQKFA